MPAWPWCQLVSAGCPIHPISTGCVLSTPLPLDVLASVIWMVVDEADEEEMLKRIKYFPHQPKHHRLWRCDQRQRHGPLINCHSDKVKMIVYYCKRHKTWTINSDCGEGGEPAPPCVLTVWPTFHRRTDSSTQQDMSRGVTHGHTKNQTVAVPDLLSTK